MVEELDLEAVAEAGQQDRERVGAEERIAAEACGRRVGLPEAEARAEAAAALEEAEGAGVVDQVEVEAAEEARELGRE